MKVNIEKTNSKINSKYLIFLIITILFACSLIFLITLKYKSYKLNGQDISIKDTINSIDITNDGSNIYLGMRKNSIDARSIDNKILWQYKTDNSILDVKSSENYVYAGSDDRRLYILNKDGKLIKNIEVSYRPISVAGDSNGKRIIASVSMDASKNRLQEYDANGNQIFNIDPGATVNYVCMYPENYNSVYVDSDSKISLIDGNGKEIKSNKIDYFPVTADFDSKSKMLVVIDQGNHVYAFDKNLKKLWSTSLNTKINTVTIDSTHNRVIAGSENGLLFVLNNKGNIIARIKTIDQLSLLKTNKASGDLYVISKTNLVKKFGASFLTKIDNNKKIFNFTFILCIALFALMIISLVRTGSKISNKLYRKIKKIFVTLYKHKISYLLLLPTMILLLIFNYYPTIYGFIIAFTDYVPGLYMRWVGISNFTAMFVNKYFWVGVGNMLLFLVTDLIKALIPPIIFAELIIAMRSKAAQYWTRVALYLPGILPGVAGLMVWVNGILSMNGLINQTLNGIGLGNLATSWLGNGKTAMGALIFIGFPWIGNYIILYGALISIPTSFYEAAKLDGCTWWKRIWKIDVPLIGPQMKFIFVTSFIASVQDFGRVYLTTEGGPGHSTYTPMLELYYNMSKFQHYGIAAAMGLFLFIVIFGATIMNLKMHSTADVTQ